MNVRSDVWERLRLYGIVHCHVRSASAISFSCQKWEVDDALEPRETMLFFHDPTMPKNEGWAAREWDMMTGVHGCPCYKPKTRWVFVSDPGEAYILGQGDESEEKIAKKRTFISYAKCIADGYAYAVGHARNVYMRQAKNRWIALHSKAMALKNGEDPGDIGFQSIDGFSDTDIYACGGIGDLWHYDGKVWHSIDVGTNANLENICCAPDGKTYITTNANVMVIGRNDRWDIVDQDVGDFILEEMVHFNGKIYVSSLEKIFEIKDSLLVETDLKLPKMDSYAHIAAGGGILVVAGIHCASMYNGKSWSRLFDFS